MDLRAHSIPNLEVFHVLTDLNHLAGDVLAQDVGPFLDEDAVVLDLPVDRVDGNRVVLRDHMVRSGLGHWGISDAEFLTTAIEPGSTVLRHGGWSGLVDVLCGVLIRMSL